MTLERSDASSGGVIEHGDGVIMRASGDDRSAWGKGDSTDALYADFLDG